MLLKCLFNRKISSWEMSRKDANSQPLLKEQQHEGECAHAGAFRRLAPSFPAWPQPAGTERRPSVPCLLVRSAGVAPEWALGLPSRGPSPEMSPLLCKGASPWAPRGAVSPSQSVIMELHKRITVFHAVFFFFFSGFKNNTHIMEFEKTPQLHPCLEHYS